MTVVIQIGNSDDKLKQSEWSEFVEAVENCILITTDRIHFHGLSPGDALWQNACWVADTDDVDKLRMRLVELAVRFRQDSIALTVGETEMVKP
jgi:hypothetical protein